MTDAIEKLENTVVELQIAVVRTNEQVYSINKTVDNIQSDVSDIHKCLLSDKSATNRRLWTWIRVLLMALVGGGVVTGIANLATDSPAEANPPTQEQTK